MKKVLLLDDSEIIRSQLKQTFESEGFRVFEAGDGLKALECVESNPDLTAIILDYAMPIMNGVMFARKVREMKNQAKIVFLSAQASETLRKEAREAGAVCWVVKPITGPALIDVVRRFI